MVNAEFHNLATQLYVYEVIISLIVSTETGSEIIAAYGTRTWFTCKYKHPRITQGFWRLVGIGTLHIY